ncbi:MAG: DUF4314 domain-containing protein [Acetobacter sp.]|nr:DUF4314 domain-containing protein [Bacteroides sp.]MCM1340805.1 DUF4314 domain-containing protein [Acetobacter sp.]MCM1432638.1 DUF4314 domain-containing protein [Clostridiales bacterium]
MPFAFRRCFTINEFLRLEKEAKIYKERYPKGTRIELLSMNDSQAVPPGTRGTVDYVDDLGSIHMNWDNGRTLAICPQEDNFRKLTEQELEDENNAICVEETSDELLESAGPTMSM